MTTKLVQDMEYLERDRKAKAERAAMLEAAMVKARGMELEIAGLLGELSTPRATAAALWKKAGERGCDHYMQIALRKVAWDLDPFVGLDQPY